LIGNRKSFRLGSKQNLRTTQSACRNHHQVRGNKRVLRLKLGPTQAVWLEVNHPLVMLPFDIANVDLCENLRIMIEGIGEVVHLNRVLRRIVAAGTAITTVDAWGLFDPNMVQIVRTGFKGDGKVGQMKRFSNGRSSLLMGFGFQEGWKPILPLRIRILLRTHQHLAGKPLPLLECRLVLP